MPKKSRISAQNYDVTFPLFAVDVNGDEAHPLFDYLTIVPGFLGSKTIKWNLQSSSLTATERPSRGTTRRRVRPRCLARSNDCSSRNEFRPNTMRPTALLQRSESPYYTTRRRRARCRHSLQGRRKDASRNIASVKAGFASLRLSKDHSGNPLSSIDRRSSRISGSRNKRA